MIRVRLTLLALIILSTTGRSPSRSEEAVPDQVASAINYEDHVKPILRQHCFSCHYQGESKGGLALDSTAALMSGGGSGEIVYAGDVEGSRLWQLITHEDTPIMPPGQDKIPQKQIDTISAWIDGGLLENSGSKVVKKKANSLAFVSSAGGKPEGPVAMPEAVPQVTPVVTERAAAITALAASPWAPLIAVAGQKQVILYHSETAELLGILPFPDGIPHSIRFSRDGANLIVAGGEHSVRGIAAIYDVKTGARVADVGDELDIAFDADINDNLSKVALGGPQKMLRVYSTADGELLFDIKKHTDWIYAVAFSPDGVLIASGDRSAGLVVWEAETGRPYLDLTDHKGPIHAIAWRDDSNVFASASEDGTIKLWDVVTGKAIKSINAHSGGVMSVAFDHAGRIVSGGKDKRVKLWDAAGNLIREFPPMSESVLEVTITHDGSRIVSGDWAGDVWMAESEKPDQKVTLAANPPASEVRQKGLADQIADLDKPFEETLARLAQAETQRDQATEKLRGLESARAAMIQRIEEAEMASAGAANRVQEIAKELPTLTTQSRDHHDQVIAGRLTLDDSAESQDKLAAREWDLSERLRVLATLRREAISQKQLADNKKTEAVELLEQDQSLAQRIQESTDALAAANSKYEKARAEHESIAGRRRDLLRRLESFATTER